MLPKYFGPSISIALVLAVSANISECVAQTYVWEGKVNGDGPFICDPPNGDPFVYFYPVSDSWVTTEVWSGDCLLAPSNWSQPDFPNSPSAMVVIPGPAPGKTYPPRLGNEISVGTVDVNTGAKLLLGGRLNITDVLSNVGRIDLLNSGYVNGRIFNGSNGVLRADNATLHGLILNEGKIELVPLSLPLQFDDAQYSGSGVIEGDPAGTSIAGKVTVLGGEMTFRKGKISVGTGLAPINLINDASVGFDDVEATIRTIVTNRGNIRVGDGATLAIGADVDNTNGVLNIASGGIAKLSQGGVINGGTINGILRLVGQATLTGEIVNAGELRFLEGDVNYLQDVHLSGGQVSGDDIGIANGKLTTEDVTFRNGTFFLGSAGFGPIDWTIAGTDTVTDIDLRLGGKATNKGRLIVADGGIFRSGNFDNISGVIEVQEGGAFIQNGGELRGGTVVGKIQVLGGTLIGEIEMEQGALVFPDGGFPFVQDAIVRGGEIIGDEMVSLIVAGNLTTDGVTFRQGTFTLNPGGTAGVDWNIIGTNTVDDMTLHGGRTTTNEGRLIVADGAVFHAGNFSNNGGVIDIEMGGVVFAQNLTNGGGTIRVDGTLHANGNLDLQEGELEGTGVVFGSVFNSNGTVAPGASPGILLVEGNYTQQQAALLSLEIGGNLPGESYDQFKVTGNAMIAGSIDIEFIDGFLPRVGDRYDLILANGGLNLASDIAISVLGVPDAFRYATVISSGNFSMEVLSVPEPSGVSLFIAVCLTLQRRRRLRTLHVTSRPA